MKLWQYQSAHIAHNPEGICGFCRISIADLCPCPGRLAFGCNFHTRPPKSTSMNSIYLDHNATTPIHPEVSAAMADCYLSGPANASSLHARGRWARSVVESARERMAQILGAQLSGSRPDRLLFTSGGTESNNLALFGIAESGP